MAVPVIASLAVGGAVSCEALTETSACKPNGIYQADGAETLSSIVEQVNPNPTAMPNDAYGEFIQQANPFLSYEGNLAEGTEVITLDCSPQDN